MVTAAVLKLVLGPVFGMFGSWLTQRAEDKKEERQAKDRAEERKHDLALIVAEADLALKKASIQADSLQAVSENESFAQSYKFASDNLIPEGAKLTTKQMNRVVWIEVINKAIRPFGVMWYQLLLAVLFGWSAWKLVNATSSAFTDAELATMFRDVAYSIIGMAETSYFWYFGIRRMSKKKDSL